MSKISVIASEYKENGDIPNGEHVEIISDDEVEILIDILEKLSELKKSKRPVKLEILCEKNSKIGGDVLNEINEFTELEELSLKNFVIKDIECLNISGMENLKKLSIVNCQIGGYFFLENSYEDISHLFESISTHASLEYVDLSGNKGIFPNYAKPKRNKNNYNESFKACVMSLCDSLFGGEYEKSFDLTDCRVGSALLDSILDLKFSRENRIKLSDESLEFSEIVDFIYYYDGNMKIDFGDINYNHMDVRLLMRKFLEKCENKCSVDL